MKQVITIKENAKKRILKLMETNEKNLLKISVVSKGCSGYRYDFKFVEKQEKLDEAIIIDATKRVIIDGSSILHLIGLELDWEEKDDFTSKFVFNNPNVNNDTLCGCGESFNFK